MKVILCKPNDKPKVVKKKKKHTYLDIKALLEIESPITCVSRKIGDVCYDFWVDDEGLFPENKCMCGICTNAKEVLCGNILIAKSNSSGNLIGLTEDEIEKVLNDKNFICNEDFLKFGGTPNYPRNENGDAMIIRDYAGFGSIYLNPMGYNLKYSI